MIIGFRAKGGSISETAEFVNCSPAAMRCVRADRRATDEQLITKMNQGANKSVSQTTIQRKLLRLGLRSRRLVRAPMLTAVHRRRRLKFARQYSSWTSTEWRQDDGIFQQDKARCHIAASVRAWSEEPQDEFTVFPWPANSPELNPIENLWDHLDRVVRAMDPQTRNLAQLAMGLESAWLNIPENTFRNLSDSLPARLAVVRSAKETPLHPGNLIVWCALWAGRIIGPYFFKNDEGHSGTVNGDRYRAMITNFFIPELNNHDVQELWFQQDGATCHTARATFDLLKDMFDDRLISCFGPVS
ncbi:transposable element Tcb1 transposase [Trichonephila clavipes]|nr:transposable element Tcb1 transposase [Trichonephila clavipes]